MNDRSGRGRSVDATRDHQAIPHLSCYVRLRHRLPANVQPPDEALTVSRTAVSLRWDDRVSLWRPPHPPASSTTPYTSAAARFNADSITLPAGDSARSV